MRGARRGRGIAMPARPASGPRSLHGRSDRDLPGRACRLRAPSHAATSGLERATVKWFNRLRGFGFLTRGENAPDIFVHIETLRRFGFSEVRLDRSSSFASDGPKGLWRRSYGPREWARSGVPLSDAQDTFRARPAPPPATRTRRRRGGNYSVPVGVAHPATANRGADDGLPRSPAPCPA